jgi:hypothetical protein
MAFLFPKLFPEYIGCLPETANGQFEMPLEDAMAFVWKAKTIKFTADLVITAQCIDFNLDPPGVETLTITLNANTIIFATEDDQVPNPQPLEKMSGIMCGGEFLVFEETATYVGTQLLGSFQYSDGRQGLETYEFTPNEYSVGPLSVKTVGENKVCDFAYGVLLDPGGSDGRETDGSFRISTVGYPSGNSNVTAMIPNGAVIKINGNTYSTDLYFRGIEYSDLFDFTSAIAIGQILIEIESERFAE